VKKLVLSLVAASSLLACGGSKIPASCQKYIACAKAISATMGTQAETAYGESSQCYGSSQATDACAAACDFSLAFAKAGNASVAACQ
jgi:hypothetical protein